VAVATLVVSAVAAVGSLRSNVPPSASASSVVELANVPVGIAVSKDERLFLAFSRAIDENEPYSVAEIRNGRPTPFPAGFKQDRGPAEKERLLSVQALTVDARNRLWILDCGRIGQADPPPGATKLVAVDLNGDRVLRTIQFPATVAGPTAFFNDIVIDLRRGSDGVAFITDASPKGPNGIVVVSLASGEGLRRLNDHPSTRPEQDFVAQVEGRPLLYKAGPTPGKPMRVGTDGIALSEDGRFLYYSPLSSHHWYRVDADLLSDPKRTNEEVVAAVEDLGDKGFASDGMLGSADGTVYLTDYEGNAIHRRRAGGALELLIRDPRLSWPDSMALGADGALYVTATQIQRNKDFRGSDERQRPFRVWRIPTDSRPLFLE
jgi:sugar lactone lactonase YvrE